MNTAAVSHGAGAMKYRPDIDGLRAVAVMAVVLHHLSEKWMPGGFVGVDVFFVISGYLITKIIHQEIQEGQFSFARFYERRIRRLFPALFVILLFVLIAGWFLLLPSDYLSTFRTSAGTVLFASNIVLWREMAGGYFSPDAQLNPLLHMWSLGVEEQFYLIFPVLLIFIQRFARRWLFWVLLASFSLSLGLSTVLTPIKSVAAYFLLPTRAWEMLVGSLLAVRPPPLLKNAALREGISSGGFLLIVGSSFLYNERTVFPGYAALLPVFGAATLIWIGGEGRPTWVTRCLQIRAVVYVGLISYSLYLWHWPLIVFARLLNAGVADLPPMWGVLLLILSFICAALSHRYVESFLRGGKRAQVVNRKQVFSWGAVAFGFLLVLSGLGIAQRGYEQRVSEDILALDRERAPEIPFRESCDKKVEGCSIGAEGGAEADILLWGDSHMLAWAPVFDDVFKERGMSVVLQVASSCPPIFDVYDERDFRCAQINDEVQGKVRLGGIKHLVIAAHWSGYSTIPFVRLREEGSVLLDGLPQMLAILKELDVATYVLGPVPTYEYNLPALRAYAAKQDRDLPYLQTRSEYLQKHREFFSVVKKFPEAMLFDPSLRLCAPDCLLSDEAGAGLYRDDDHLSVSGALLFRLEIEKFIHPLLSTEQAVDLMKSEETSNHEEGK